MFEDDKARKNALILIAKNLNKAESMIDLENGIKTHMGEKNVMGIFFRQEGRKHVGTCNIQCLNVVVYKKFSKKNGKILGKYVEFTPHPKSLDGANAPSLEELIRLGFSDVNTALANTIEALENAPYKPTNKALTKEELNKMVEEAVNKGTMEIRSEMISMKDTIVKEAQMYVDSVQKEATKT